MGTKEARTMRRWILPLLALAATIPACTHHPHTSNVTSGTSLFDTVWRVEMLGPETAVITASKPWMRIESDGTVTGNTGCNNLSANATVDGSSLTFSPVTTTKRECDPPIMETENAVLAGLQSTRTWAVDGKYLGLLDERGHYVMKLVRAKGRDAVEPAR